MILDQHKRWLTNQSNGKRANFSLEDLSGFDLTSVMLSKAKLTGANMSRCTLRARICPRPTFSASIWVARIFATSISPVLTCAVSICVAPI